METAARTDRDIYFDGASHYYIDGAALDSGTIPVFMADADVDKCYRVAETGNWLILPYDEENWAGRKTKSADKLCADNFEMGLEK